MARKSKKALCLAACRAKSREMRAKRKMEAAACNERAATPSSITVPEGWGRLTAIRTEKYSGTGNQKDFVRLRTLIGQRIERIWRDVYAAIRYRSTQQGSLQKRMEYLEGDIKNAPYHAFGQHSKCAGYYRCDNSEVNFIPDLLNQVTLFAKVMEHTNQVACHSKSLIHCYDSNKCEHFNSVVAKFVCGKRINFSHRTSYQTRCWGAVISHNTKNIHSKTHKAFVERSPGSFTKRMEASRLRGLELSKKRRLQVDEERQTNKRRRLFTGPDRHYGPNADKPVAPLSSKQKEEQRKELLQSVTGVTEDQMNHIERETRSQAGCKRWIQERGKRLTASNFGRVCHLTVRSNKEKTADLLLKVVPLSTAMRYGVDNESNAIECLQNLYNIKIERCGFFIDREKQFLGASPDGIVVGENSIVEVKCPFTARFMSIADCVRQKRITYLIPKQGELTGSISQFKLKNTHNYYYQVQGQLNITGREKCYFIVWSERDAFVDVIVRDDNFWKRKMEKHLVDFYHEYMIDTTLRKNAN